LRRFLIVELSIRKRLFAVNAGGEEFSSIPHAAYGVARHSTNLRNNNNIQVTRSQG